MTIRSIKRGEDYEQAVAEIASLMNAEPGSAKADRLEVLSVLVAAWEDEHYAIPAPDPVEAILHVMENRGITRKDLERYIGNRSRV